MADPVYDDDGIHANISIFDVAAMSESMFVSMYVSMLILPYLILQPCMNSHARFLPR